MTDRAWITGEPKDPPEVIKWYEVLYRDGTIGESCWWLGVWYCNAFWYDVVAYREKLEEKPHESG